MEGNIKVNKEKNYVLVSVNPRFYSAEVALSAAYMFLDKCYVLVDGDPQEEIFIELHPKNKTDLLTLGRMLNSELVNYANQMMSTIRNQDIRDAMLKKFLKSK